MKNCEYFFIEILRVNVKMICQVVQVENGMDNWNIKCNILVARCIHNIA